MHLPRHPLALGATLLAVGALGTGVALAAAGDQDAGFNGGAPVRIAFGDDASLLAMTIAPDGSIFTAAGSFGEGSAVVLSHLNANGTPVAGFGPGGDGIATDAVAGLSAAPGALAVASDGDLLVGVSANAVLPQEGRAAGGAAPKVAPGAWGTNDESVIGDFTVERYDASGTRVGETRVNVDPANDGSGYRFGRIVALVPQADGSLLVLGSAWVGGDGEHFVRVLLDADGQPVSTFGDDGVAVDPDAPRYAEVGGHQAAGGPAGSAVIAGTDATDNYILRRYLADGSVDPTYGGTHPHANIHSMSITSSALAPDGSVYIYNTAVGAIARFTPDGKPDTGYAPAFDDSNTIVYAMAVQADGKLLLAGRTADGGNGATVTRLNVSGSVDTTYGDGGTRTIPLADDLTGMTPSVLAVQTDGKTVLAGNAYNYPPLELRARAAALEPGQSVGFVTRLAADPPATTTETTTTTQTTVTTPPAPAPPAAAKPVVAASTNPLPKATSCASRRSFRIRLRIPRGDVATSATVKVNGKRVKVVKGSRLRAPIDLRGLPKGKATISIVVKLAGGKKPLTGTRVYHTCTAKRTGSIPRL
ncbi:hypothetical protein DSM104299_03609 [Baekduia alba]|uniref:hypothetical protein n=1 Tax=Baekduia alba TaxID=2997333 RepID=UPI00234041F2|nr:hypothetical protein [Baekduia alba]WCB94869.1 hypothetical protein DSM104299_03609 [Baekduia alba]